MTEVNLYLENKDKKLKTYHFEEDVTNIDTARMLLFKYVNSFYLNSKYRITSLIDKIYMGWFIRVLNNPRFFIQRIFKSIKLIKIVFNEKIILINK
jgi:hypothetical protein